MDTSGPFYIAHNGNIPNVKNHDTTYIRNLLEGAKGSMEEKLISFTIII